MAIETREKVIGNCNYAVTQFPARHSLRLKTRLLKSFGASLTQLLMNALDPDEKPFDDLTDKEKKVYLSVSPVHRCEVREIRKASIVKGIELLVSGLEETAFEALCLELLKCTRKDGVELTNSVIDNEFAGNLLELYQVILFVLEVNYADFFGLTNIGNPLSGMSQQTKDAKKTYTYK